MPSICIHTGLWSGPANSRWHDIYLPEEQSKWSRFLGFDGLLGRPRDRGGDVGHAASALKHVHGYQDLHSKGFIHKINIIIHGDQDPNRLTVKALFIRSAYSCGSRHAQNIHNSAQSQGSRTKGFIVNEVIKTQTSWQCPTWLDPTGKGGW